MITIAGLGISGGYLLRRLVQDGFEAKGYDPKAEGFYVPCGYATNRNRLGNLLNNIGLDVNQYVETRAENVIISTEAGRELTFSPTGLCTIDKNRLENDMISGLPYERKRAEVPEEPESTLIDATGISRYYLGQAAGDLQMFTKEYLSGESTHQDFYFRYFSAGRGYYWEFPIGGKYHIGAGGDNRELVEDAVKWVEKPHKVASRKIRLSPLFDHMFNGNVIGVGEAIGTVSPITGEGILPSMESAEILFQCLKKYSEPHTLKREYEAAIRKEFGRYIKLFQILQDARSGDLRKLGNLSAVKSVKQDFENFGIELKITKVLKQLALG